MQKYPTKIVGINGYSAKIAEIHTGERWDSTYLILCQNTKDGGTAIWVTTSSCVELGKGLHVRYGLKNESEC